MNTIFFEKLPNKFRSKDLDNMNPNNKLIIYNVNIDPLTQSLSALVSIDKKNDDKYRWNYFDSYRAAGQLLLGYICSVNNKNKSSLGELHQISLKCDTRHPLFGSKDKHFSLKIEHFKKWNDKYIGSVHYVVDDNYFSSNIKFILGFEHKKESFSSLENLAINFFTPLDTIYNYKIKFLLNKTSMYDFVIEKNKAESFSQIYRVISSTKKEKVQKLINIKNELGEIPSKYYALCNKTPCAYLRFWVAESKVK